MKHNHDVAPVNAQNSSSQGFRDEAYTGTPHRVAHEQASKS